MDNRVVGPRSEDLFQPDVRCYGTRIPVSDVICVRLHVNTAVTVLQSCRFTASNCGIFRLCFSLSIRRSTTAVCSAEGGFGVIVPSQPSRGS